MSTNTYDFRLFRKFGTLGRQVRPGIEPGTFHLPVLKAQPFWALVGLIFNEKFKNMKII